jgi:hypothetical protein
VHIYRFAFTSFKRHPCTPLSLSSFVERIGAFLRKNSSQFLIPLQTMKMKLFLITALKSELDLFVCQVEMGGTRGPITTFIVEPFIPHRDEYYLSIVSDRLGVNFSFSECGGIDIEENWDKV